MEDKEEKPIPQNPKPQGPQQDVDLSAPFKRDSGEQGATRVVEQK